MTDRVQTLTVILDDDYRTDDVQMIVDAISMLKGVAGVELGSPVDMNDHLARERALMEIRSELAEFLKPDWLRKKTS